MREALAAARNPYEWFMIGFVLLVGALGLVDTAAAGASVARRFPLPVLYLWFGSMTALGLVCVAGLLLVEAGAHALTRSTARRAFDLTSHGLLVEQFGLWPLTVLTSQYAVIVLIVGGARAVVPAVIALGFAAASAVRAAQIARAVRRLRRALRAGGS